jgi:ATP-dependent Clp protease ATP-binding subunit ClpC
LGGLSLTAEEITVYPFERFTERAKKVLALAQEEAERSHHSYIGTEHLLIGLLRERDGLAAHVLANLGIDIGAVREVIRTVLGRSERIIIQQIIPTSRVKKVIELSFEEARRMGHDYVGTEHMLLGLMLEGEGIGAHVLQDLGVTLDNVRAEIERLLLLEPKERPAPRSISYEAGQRVLVHDPDRPHRLWEGRITSVEGKRYQVTVPGHPSGNLVEAEEALIHPVPMIGTRACPYCTFA